MSEIPTQARTAEPEVQELSLHDFLLTLWRGRWVILICTAVSTAIGLKYATARGTIWRATSQIYVEQGAPAMLSGDGLVAMNNRNYANTQAELLRSPKVIEQTLLRPEVAGSQIFPEAANKVAWVRKNLKVSAGLKDDILSVSLDNALVEDACLIVNGIVETFRRLHSEKGNSRARELKSIAIEKRDEEQEALDELHSQLVDFLITNDAIALDDREGGSFASRRLDAAFVELRGLKSELEVAKGRLATAKSLAEEPRLVREFLGEPNARFERKADRVAELALTDLLRRSTEIEDELRTTRKTRTRLLEAGRTESNATIVALDAQLDDLVRQQDAVATNLESIADGLEEYEREAEENYAESLVAKLEREFEDLGARVRSTQSLYDDLEAEAKAIAPRRAELRRLENRIEQTEAIIEGLNVEISDYSKADISEEERAKITIDVLGRATPETATPAASIPKSIAIFFLLGGILGCGLAWLRSLLDGRVRSEEDVTRPTGLPALGALPRTRLREEHTDALQAWEDHSSLAEAARGLRTALSFSFAPGEGKVLQVTSADKGEGKSTTSAQLAIALARGGQRTLLIDGDLRSPSVAKQFHIPNDQGLSNVLAHGVMAADVIRPTRLEGLDLLPTGPIPPNPAELLSSATLALMLEQVASKYDRVLIDSPPVLAVSDSRVVATQVEGTILVARVDKSYRRRIVSTCERLFAVGGKVVGVVINDVPRSLGYGYGYGYGYGVRDAEHPRHLDFENGVPESDALGKRRPSSTPRVGRDD